MQDLTALFEPVVESMGYELVGIEYHSSEHHGVLRIYIDHDEGITVDDCAKVSRQISAVIDVEDPIEMAFDLEVSSPGINRPLFKLTDYQKYAGAMVKIKLGVALNGRKNFNGIIQSVDENQQVIIDVDNEIFELPYQDIAKANLVNQV